ncbi:MAG: MBL fold metallo-hydrolase [Clostridia bacterium]|nr:MBL fold metallo-hydrolase [Clostridia bacterium]
MFDVKIWGARGSMATYGTDYIKYSGNTSCVSVEIDERVIILDAGTGIINLGNYLMEIHKPVKASIFLSHYHYDHILGLLSFVPLFTKDSELTFFGEAKYDLTLEETLHKFMQPPFFPIGFSQLTSNIIFNNITETDNIQFVTANDHLVNIIPKNTKHPGGNLAYKITVDGRSMVYLTDFAHYDDEHQPFVEYVKNCDLLIYDANFTKEEYHNKQYAGWGHSHWEKATKLANDANVKKLILFHHKSDRTDAELEEILRGAREKFINTFLAKEGDHYQLL